MAAYGNGPTPGFVRALSGDDPVELYEMAPCGYVSTEEDGRIVKVNGTFCDWTGLPSSELVGRSFQSLLGVGDRIFYETHLAPSLALQGSVREIAAQIMCADGQPLPVLLNAVRAVGLDGSARIRIAIFDATERRLYERELLAERARSEAVAAQARALAETLQRALLPASIPEIDGVDLGAVYRPAGDGGAVGGDFYDVFQIDADTWGISLGDVCGKGPAAATTTALVRHSIRALAIGETSPRVVLAGVHDAISHSEDGHGFVTAVFVIVRVDSEGLHLQISSGGHHLPRRVGADGTVVEVGRHGSLLGMVDPLNLHEDAATLGHRESLVLITDGVVEARRGGEQYGERRLHELLADRVGASAQELAEMVVIDALEFEGGGQASDDIAVVVLQSKPG